MTAPLARPSFSTMSPRPATGRTQLVARLIDHSKGSERFGPTDFTLNEDGSLTCPNGQESRKFYRAVSADGYIYRFSAAQCQGCPLWQRCRGDDPASQSDAASAEPASAEPVALPAKAASAKQRKVEPTDAASTATEPVVPEHQGQIAQGQKGQNPQAHGFPPSLHQCLPRLAAQRHSLHQNPRIQARHEIPLDHRTRHRRSRPL